MLRIRFTLMIAVLLVGCTSAPVSPTESIDPPIITEPTAVEPSATGELSTESPTAENTFSPNEYGIQEYAVPAGTHPHDVAPAPDGTIWYTAQFSGALGRLDPATGETRHIPLGAGSSPHGVIVGPDGAPWITDSGLNAIVRVDPQTEDVQVFSLPSESGNANLNTAAFDRGWPALVYGSRRHLWPSGAGNRKHGSLSLHRTGAARMASQPRLTVRSIMRHWQAATLAVSIRELAKHLFLSHQLQVKGRGVSGQIRRVEFGSVSGTQARYRCMIQQTRRGANGNCRVTTLKPTQFMSTIRIWSG